jgi:cytochrome b561
MSQKDLIMILIGLFVLWRVYSRVKRMVGRQQSKLWRHWAAVIFLPLLLVLMALGTAGEIEPLAALVGGVAAGVGLALWGLRLTKFEQTTEGYFYTPNAHIGIALSLFLVARIGYRFYTLSTLAGPEMGKSMQSFGRSPLTLVIVGTMLGYFASYAAGLLRWRRGATNTPVAIGNA